MDFKWKFYKPWGVLTHLDCSSLTDSWTLSHTDCLLLLSGVDCHSRHPSPTAFRWVPLSHSWLAFLYPLPVMSRSQAQAFVWFRAKTDKGIVCFLDHLHSVTGWSYQIKKWIYLNEAINRKMLTFFEYSSSSRKLILMTDFYPFIYIYIYIYGFSITTMVYIQYQTKPNQTISHKSIMSLEFFFLIWTNSMTQICFHVKRHLQGCHSSIIYY